MSPELLLFANKRKGSSIPRFLSLDPNIPAHSQTLTIQGTNSRSGSLLPARRNIGSLDLNVDRVKAVQRHKGRALLEEYPALDEVWKRFRELVLGVRACGDREDVVQFLQRALLRFRDEEEDHDECDDVEATERKEKLVGSQGLGRRVFWERLCLRVETKGADGVELVEKCGEREREDAGPEEACRDRPRHAHFAVGKGEDLSGVSERNGAFTRGIECSEQEDKKSDEAKVCGTGLGDQGAETGS
jgi:hypothetical protein